MVLIRYIVSIIFALLLISCAGDKPHKLIDTPPDVVNTPATSTPVTSKKSHVPRKRQAVPGKKIKAASLKAYVKKFKCEKAHVAEIAREQFVQLLSKRTNLVIVSKENEAELLIEGAIILNGIYTMGVSSMAISKDRLVVLGNYSESFKEERKSFYTTDNMATHAVNILINNLREKGIVSR